MPVTDPAHPFSYASPEAPPTYKCGTCGKHGVKLWRDYNTFLDHQALSCADCTAADQHKDISTMQANGSYTNADGFPSDQMGWRVPAVPTEENDTFWGYTSVPAAGCEWWAKLPNR
jgi:hypothetical protein